MRKLWYCLFYGLCAFTIAFSLYWMAAAPPAGPGLSPSGPDSAASSPSLRAGAALSGVREEEGYYLCEEGGRLAVWRCDAAGAPRERLELTDIYLALLPEADAQRCRAGFCLWSRQELDRLLEDLGA